MSEHEKNREQIDVSHDFDELEGFDSAPSAETEEGLLPTVADEGSLDLDVEPKISIEGTELEAFESANVDEVEFVEDERLDSILESILFASDRPVSLASIKLVFKGTNIKGDKIKRALDRLAIELAGFKRGVTLEEVPGGYQIRTKVDNMKFLGRSLKARPFRLSGPALEVLSIVAYKQPIIKSEIDEIRGVESGHLLRALMEKNLVLFDGKSDLPGKPMQYSTSKKFMEIFGLRNLRELPTLSQIDELLPEGIGEEDEEKSKLSDLTDGLSQAGITSYSQGEEDLNKIAQELEDITTSTQFFEEEKRKQREKKDQERAQSIREALMVGEEVSNRDKNWLTRFDTALQAGQKFDDEEVTLVTNTLEQVPVEEIVDEGEEFNETLTEFVSDRSIEDEMT